MKDSIVSYTVGIIVVLFFLWALITFSAGPIYFTRHPVVASENKEIIVGLAEAGKRVSSEDFKTLVYDMATLRAVVILPKGVTIECVFDCGDVFLGRIIATPYHSTELIGREFWFIIVTVEPNTA